MSGVVTIEVNEKKLRNAAKVANHASINQIFLSKLDVQNNLADQLVSENFSCDVRFGHRILKHNLIDQQTLAVEVLLKFEFYEKHQEAEKTNGDEEETILVDISIAYMAIYKLPEPPIPKEILEKGIQAFSELNGTYNCWPYFRQKIQSLTAEMNVPYVLPVLKIVPEKTKEEKPVQKKRKTKQINSQTGNKIKPGKKQAQSYNRKWCLTD